MFTGLLPIGTVVLVGNSKKKVMIVGLCQRGGAEGKLWDYAGVIYPEGFIDSNKMFLFNHEQISQVYALGYQDAEQIAFKKKSDSLIQELRNREG